MPTVKLGRSRQVVIPKKIHDDLGLKPGDLLEVDREGDKVVFTPKELVDRDSIEKRLAEALKDIGEGRVSPAFTSATSAIRYLRRQAKKLKKSQ